MAIARWEEERGQKADRRQTEGNWGRLVVNKERG
jgi:hypothetical protein